MNRHSADELLQAYARGEREFSYWSLTGVDLHGADLRDSNFYGSDLSGANLSGADLSRANLGNTDLHYANVSGANVSGAFYEGANLTGAETSGIVTDNPSPILASQQAIGVGQGGSSFVGMDAALPTNIPSQSGISGATWQQQLLCEVWIAPSRGCSVLPDVWSAS